MQDELNDKSRDVFSKIKGKVKVHFSALKNINGMETLFFKAQEWTRVIKEKIIVTWGSGVKGKAAIAVASLALLWLLFPSCAGGGDGKLEAGGGVISLHDCTYNYVFFSLTYVLLRSII